MLHALLRKKFLSVQSEMTQGYRDAEDHLTAAVLSRLCYVPADVAFQIVENAVFGNPGCGRLPETDLAQSGVSVLFWPRYADATKTQQTVEPDAVLRIGSHVYIVEAKRKDHRAQNPAQVHRNWQAWWNDPEEEARRTPDQTYTILMLGGIPDPQQFARIACEVKYLVTQSSHSEFEPRVAWTSWQKLSTVISEFSGPIPYHTAHVIDDIQLALEHHGFGVRFSFKDLVTYISTIRLPWKEPMAFDFWPQIAPQSSASKAMPRVLSPLKTWLDTQHGVGFNEPFFDWHKTRGVNYEH